MRMSMPAGPEKPDLQMFSTKNMSSRESIGDRSVRLPHTQKPTAAKSKSVKRAQESKAPAAGYFSTITAARKNKFSESVLNQKKKSTATGTTATTNNL